MDNKPENHILEVMKQAKVSLTINSIADLAAMHRVTASKYLAVLEAKGLVSRRDVGKAKLYFIKGRRME
ncbi:MAG: helix-turn-helix domain-containing protein [Candidatus Aenigmarchaeota archaeon]|nr:helix-turn-helix domain-containing protein [Candidatus Aenigmarchaeota archaeon]